MLAKDPLSMRSIVKQNQALETNYRFGVCYQNIEFDLNQDLSDNSKYWQVNKPEQCQIYDVSDFAWFKLEINPFCWYYFIHDIFNSTWYSGYSSR